MIICPNCGTNNDKEAIICRNCGGSLQERSVNESQLHGSIDQKKEQEVLKKKSLINPFSIGVKALALILVILAFLFPWNNVSLGEYNPFAAFFIILLLVSYIIGTAMTYIGILKSKRANLLEKIGIYIDILAIFAFFIFNAFLFIAFPSYRIQLEIGVIFATSSFVLIVLDKLLLRKLVFRKLTMKMRIKKEKKRIDEVDEDEKQQLKDTEKSREEEKELISEETGEKKKEKATQKPIEPKKEEKKKKFTEKIINPFSVLLKIIAFIILFMGLFASFPIIDLADYNEIGALFIRGIIWISVAWLSISIIGLIKIRFIVIIEKIALLSAYGCIFILFIIQLINVLGGNRADIYFEVLSFIIFLSLLIFSIENFIFRRYYRERKEKKEEKPQKKKEEPILDRYARIKTKAGFPERWAMIYGEKPTENENFEHFKELEIEKPSSTYHPNYLHLSIEHLIEDKGYRIESSEKPLAQTDDSYKFYDLNGTIKGSVKVKLGGNLEFASITLLLLGTGFLFTSLILIFINLIQVGFYAPIVLSTLFILIPLSLIFPIYYFIKSLKESSLKEIGYTNIYVLEQGSAYYGRETKGMEIKDAQRTLQNPSIGFKMKLSFATSVKMMDLEDAKNDLDAIVAKVQEF